MMDKEKKNGGKPGSPLERYARELPQGLHERVMTSVREDAARCGSAQYRRLRITAVLAAAMLCVFAVSSAILVMPFLMSRTAPNSASGEAPFCTGGSTLQISEENNLSAGSISEEADGTDVRYNAMSTSSECVNDPDAFPYIAAPKDDFPQSPLATPETREKINNQATEASPAEPQTALQTEPQTVLQTEPQTVLKTEPQSEAVPPADAYSSADSENGQSVSLPLAAVVLVSGISAAAAVILTAVQRKKIRSRQKQGGQENDR